MQKGTEQLFIGGSLLTERLGRWPSFHDAEVLRLELSRSEDVALRMHVYLFTTSPQLDERGCYKRENEAVVTLAFRGVQELSLAGFNEQNVLQELVVAKLDDSTLRVEAFSSYGLSGSFLCTSAEVSQVQPNSAGSA